MSTPVKINKIVYDRSESIGDFPYTVTLFATVLADLSEANYVDTNTGATDPPVFVDDMVSAADWEVED